ncbi:DUF4383 domain-containing protein [Spirilliplanes yamanashiensis]|uniref:DUF4383 domain-containing protein n=1 Tax=Spirilliplanes yamanashiensis TaxID=42233 RepID=A0A8J3Y3I2_9ACTN|nr:DUF4383 domain-containing protein [Spirilliplanes yamanashiensis]MDP9814219.1 putative membrane protein [Spirilliplanes yamanashiensis]GIJ00799.1 hypothetical protein Sya03_01510 [Spirilliplanes yamanashiensis]
MAHYPVNHRFRGTYRGLAALCGLLFLVAGIVGIIVTSGGEFFSRGSHWALGLRTNPAQAWLSVVIGVVLVAAAAIGGNVHHRVSSGGGWALMVLGVFGLAVLQTDVNVFNFSVVNIIVLLVTGLVVLLAGLYGKVDDDPEAAERERIATAGRG